MCSSVKGVYLSEDACQALGCLPTSFPTPLPAGSVVGAEAAAPTLPKCTNTGVPNPTDTPCQCPRWSPPPTNEPCLPCEPTEANLPRIKQYSLDQFASSALNCCEQQPLPLVTEPPPLRLFVDESATPIACRTPNTVPAHWYQDVKAGLDHDERLGTIERVPVNEPVTWCRRMVLQAEHDGSPRRTSPP